MPPPNPNCINPRDDPEIIWLAEELKTKYKAKGFYGTVTIHMEAGLIKHISTNETHLLPRHILPTPPG